MGQRIARAAFAIVGLALLAYGGWLAWEFASSRTINAVQGAAWFVGGPLVHDGLVAPLVGVTGLLIVRFVPAAWRAPLAVGIVLSAVLTLLAIPLLWRPFGIVTNPGLHDRDYAAGFLIALGVVWLVVLVTGIARQVRGGATPRPPRSGRPHSAAAR